MNIAKMFYLFILMITFPACGSLTQQYGTTEINRCPSCKNFAIEVQNFHPTTQVIKIDDVVVELAPNKRRSKEVMVPIDSAQVAQKGYAIVLLEYGGYKEEMKMRPGEGKDLRPWMAHIADIQ